MKQNERDDILTLLNEQRSLFLLTLRGLTDERARTRSTASQLTLTGLLNHLCYTEENWLNIVRQSDPDALFDAAAGPASHSVPDGVTLDDLRSRYERGCS